MGCWNKTCGITQFPIFSDDEVVTFIIVEGGFRADNHPTYIGNNGWNSIPIPFFGKYNDYGWMEGTGDEAEAAKFAFLKSEYGDRVVAVEKEKSRAKLCYPNLVAPFDNIESIGDTIHGNVFELKNRYAGWQGHSPTVRLAGFMINKAVWDKFTSENLAKNIKALKKFIKAKDKAKADMGDADAIKAEYRELSKKKTEGKLTDDEKVKFEAVQNEFFKIFEFETGRCNKFMDEYFEKNFPKYWWNNDGASLIKWIFRDHSRMDSGHDVDINTLFTEGVISIEETVRLYKFYTAMDALRKQFAPQIGEGSQGGFNIYHKMLIESMQEIKADYTKKMKEWGCDEDDE